MRPHFGRVDALVNAAAITDRGTILDTSPGTLDRMFAVMCARHSCLMQEVIKVMRREKTEARSSISAPCRRRRASPSSQPLCVEGGLETLTRNTAYAVLRNRIRVSGLNIG
ncbi:SDR family oxidoreductase [Sinorhizobium meliloti]|nr:SDR family oxidoreductase [Sinorhizobium meliloti]